MKNLIGTRLKKIITKRRITQGRLADISGLTPAAISLIISGARNPSLSSVMALIRALKITPNQLLK